MSLDLQLDAAGLVLGTIAFLWGLEAVLGCRRRRRERLARIARRLTTAGRGGWVQAPPNRMVCG